MQEEVLKAAIEVFDEKGIRFTMDDLAGKMRISKRTLYEIMPSKEEIIAQVIERVFADIKKQEREICGSSELDIIEKIRRVVCLLPRNAAYIDYNRVYEIKRFYPQLYKRIDDHLAGEWEVTLGLFKQGMEEGKIRDVNLNVIRQIILGTFRNMFDDSFLGANDMNYEQALKEMMDIIIDGIAVKNK